MIVATPAPGKTRQPSSTLNPQRRVFRLLAIVTLPLLAIACALIVWSAQEHRARISERRAFHAEAAAMAVHSYLTGDLGTLRTIAISPVVTGRAPPGGLAVYLERFLAANPDWEGLGVFDSRGVSIASTSSPPAALDISSRDYFKTLQRTGKPIVSAELRNQRTGNRSVVLAVPVQFDSGDQGTLATSIPVRELEETLAPYAEAAANIRLIDSEGNELVHINEHGTIHVSDPTGAKTPVRETSATVMNSSSGERLVVAAPVDDYGFGVILEEPTSVVFRPAWARLATEVSLVALALALMAVGGWYFGGKLALYTRRAEDARARAEHAQVKLEDAVKTRDWVLASASHDLRSPLASIHLTAQFLRSQISSPEPPSREQIDSGLARIARAGKQMTALIDSLLDVARLQMGKPLKLSRRSVDIVGLVNEIVSERQRLAERHNLRIITDDEGLIGHWDRTRVERVLVNLIDNAIKYSPKGGDVIVRLSHDRRADHAVIEIEDCGIGIPEQDIGRLFSRFARGGNVGGIPGTGMGLAGAQRIIEEHDGSISVKSRPGHGSLFTVRLPRDTGSIDTGSIVA